MEWHEYVEDHAETREEIEECIASRRAWIDQRREQFNRQYDMTHPFRNEIRFQNLEIWEFQLEMAEWELDQCWSVGES